MFTKSISIALIMLASFLFACDTQNSLSTSDDSIQNLDSEEMITAINDLPKSDLADSVKDGLVFMREEEKLARDVYLYFYQEYNLRVFSNIANAESTHMNAIKLLLDKYELEDPVVDDAMGKFQNQELTDLYVSLTNSGDTGLLEALKVGATIEDLDIRDLMKYSESIESEDVLLVYNNLTRGSRNHMRAYYRQITRNGGTYEPQFISQELFDSIINSAQERGRW